jgi:hypothetical protein
LRLILSFSQREKEAIQRALNLELRAPVCSSPPRRRRGWVRENPAAYAMVLGADDRVALT